jgi:TonB family protein
MKQLADPPAVAPEPDFLLRLDTAADTNRIRNAVIASALLHLVLTAVIWTTPFEATTPRGRFPEITAQRVTPLVVPPDIIVRELTQKAPNTREVAKEFDVQSLQPRPEVKQPKLPPVVARSPQPRAGVPQASLPDAPQIAAASPQPQALPPPGLSDSNTPPPPPQIETQERPRISFENVPGTGRGLGNREGGQAGPKVNIPKPSSTVSEAVAAVSRRPGGGLIVGDEAIQAPGLGESLSQKAAPGRMGSSLELLSDPQGADFRPYLIKVLSAVRRNWFAVIPESARMGRRGRVLIQFAISRDGRVPKLVIATPSGAEPLDRAAVAGISASNPFPPLPTEFRGDQIRLQLSFVYNGQQ